MKNLKLAFSRAARKFHIALAAAVVTATPLVADGVVDRKDVAAIAVAFLGALGVFAAANRGSSWN